MQSLLDPTSLFATNRNGINVLLFRWQDLGDLERREENARHLLSAIESRAAQFQVPLLVVPCPGDEGPELHLDSPNVFLLDRVDSWYPVRQKFSVDGERLGGIPYTEDFYAALASAIVRAAHAIHHEPFKVLALDCDQTLWEGICGEDGPEGVRLTEGHRALQEFALRQRSGGTLITLLSKNNLADVEETFAKHPEFPLRWSEITAQRIDWNPKSIGLESLSAELSLGMDSFVFLDDNEKEVSEMDERLPQVLALSLPRVAAEYGEYLDHLWAFDRMRLTEADAARAASYEKVQEFGKALHASHSLEDFYKSLELKVAIRPVVESELARSAQLTQRTNQFNLTTIRLLESDLQIMQREGVEVFGIHVSDRFGDYGFTGLLIVSPPDEQYRVENFLLSCRVLGRGVEHRVMQWLGTHAGGREVQVPFLESAKNTPAREFLESLGLGSYPAILKSSDLQQVKFQAAKADSAGKVQAPSKQQPRSDVDYGHIASRLNSVERIRAAQKAPLKHVVGFFATATEDRLAAIWSDLLGANVPNGESGFFDLGGHSLLVVLLLMRVREEFGVSLGIDDVYAADVTLERMARRIDEMVAFDGVGGEEYERILAVIEAMSEDEALAALAEEHRLNAHSVSF